MKQLVIFQSLGRKKQRMGALSKKLLGMGITTLMLTSCGDFLDTLPLNDVVLENFWTQKSDVTSVLNSCYESLESSDCITRMGLWGEIRSDNMIQGASTSYQVSDILKENLLPTNGFTNWLVFYQTINRCNTVCHYAPVVQAKDPNYTDAQMRANIAEATAIRALCYFYLIRTFKDVPYTTRPSIDDTEIYQIPATPFNAVLDSIINDLESVKDFAVRRYYTDDSSNAYYNSSRITRWAIYAMLADMYLWKGDWDKCISYCDLILDYKKLQYKELREKDVNNVADLELFNGYPLIMEQETGSVLSGHAYNEIFGNGNSFESIFELYFRNNQSVSNSWVTTYYGSNSNVLGQLSAPDFLYKDAATGNNKLYTRNDCRVYENMQSASSRYAITKYARQTVSMNTKNVTTEADLKLQATRRSNAYSNWIIYRMTDIMLIKAEASVQKGEENFPVAFSLVNAVNKRAKNAYTSAVTDTLKAKDYQSKQQLEELVLDERQRELLFEGKRWFDLVRLARRDGDTHRLVSRVVNKYVDNVNAIRIKLADPNIIYWPYYEEELKVNPYLVQNPAYNTGDNSQLSHK